MQTDTTLPTGFAYARGSAMLAEYIKRNRLVAIGYDRFGNVWEYSDAENLIGWRTRVSDSLRGAKREARRTAEHYGLPLIDR